ncbi:Lrp/AsnC family transcriptional regulator [Arenibaculum sp.]|jgi:DNA-binding Lrp family transcriptional regulator|uniref:Lrp/AsnC family transcriptional regulator n=1 Tax=Arenibaculum sp. TaxID=2865862 RepID=UPI002E159721|nr:Lrp/AsnC family transcriptional regulator [Arenibaculum sp.]
MDRIDVRLLEQLQENADRSAEQLMEDVPLSASAIQRRIRRLKDDGVIERVIAVANPRKVGAPVCCIVSLEIERERPELLAQLRRWLNHERQIQQAYYVTGDADFVLVVAAPDMESYEALMARLMHDNANVRRFTTNVSLGPVKRGLAVPIDGA